MKMLYKRLGSEYGSSTTIEYDNETYVITVTSRDNNILTFPAHPQNYMKVLEELYDILYEYEQRATELEETANMEYDRGYEEGVEEGREDAYDNGYSEGYDEGREYGREEYKDDYYQSGHDDGYEEGFSDGRREAEDECESKIISLEEEHESAIKFLEEDCDDKAAEAYRDGVSAGEGRFN